MAEVFLVCEGEPDSRDAALLKRMMGRLGLFVTVHPAGGDGGLRGVHAYLRATRAGSVGLTIEDRNYRSREAALATWEGEKSRLIWSRHEIENYLLHPRVLSRAFERMQDAAGSSPWVRQLPRDEGTIRQHLAAAARPLLDDHAARVLCFELYTETTHDNPAVFRTVAPPRAPNMRAPGRSDWLPALTKEAERVRRACGRVHQLGSLEPAHIDERYRLLLAEAHEPAFLSEGHFLVDMAGQELLCSFAAELRSAGVPKLVWNPDLDAELVEAFADVYQPGALFEPDDFDRLRARLELLGRAGPGGSAQAGVDDLGGS